MILVSFSSVDDALFNDVNNYYSFSSESTENLPVRIFWDTRYRPELPKDLEKGAEL